MQPGLEKKKERLAVSGHSVSYQVPVTAMSHGNLRQVPFVAYAMTDVPWAYMPVSLYAVPLHCLAVNLQGGW